MLNNVSGSHSLVTGQDNNLQAGFSHSLLAGRILTATASYQSLFGIRTAMESSHQGFSLSTSTRGQSYVATPLLAVGNGGMIFGSQSAPWFNNAFTVYNDGSATIDGNLYVNGRGGLGMGAIHAAQLNANTLSTIDVNITGNIDSPNATLDDVTVTNAIITNADISHIEPKGGISMGAFTAN